MKRLLKFTAFAVAATASLAALSACFETETAGVQVDTNTGNTLAGVLLDTDGNPVARTLVYAVSAEHLSKNPSALLNIEASNSTIQASLTDDKGSFSLDGVKGDSIRILALDSTGLSGVNLDITDSLLADSTSYDTLALGSIQMKGALSVYIAPSEYGLSEGDTVYAQGTLAYAIVGDTDRLALPGIILNDADSGLTLVTGTLSVDKFIPASSDTSACSEGATWVSDGEIACAQETFTPTLDRAGLTDSATTLETFPYPVKLPKTMESPCLESASGKFTVLHPYIESDDSVIYLAEIESLDLAQAAPKFLVHADCGKPEGYQWTAMAHGNMENLDTTISPVFFPDVTMMDGTDTSSVGVSVWFQADSTEQVEGYGRIFGARNDTSTIILQRRGATGSVNLRIDTRYDSTGGVYNKLVGTAQLLDGKLHNYIFDIHDSTVEVYVDGAFYSRDTFNRGKGFTKLTAPALGGDPNITGSVGKVLVTRGNRSESWWQAFYRLNQGL